MTAVLGGDYTTCDHELADGSSAFASDDPVSRYPYLDAGRCVACGLTAEDAGIMDAETIRFLRDAPTDGSGMVQENEAVKGI